MNYDSEEGYTLIHSSPVGKVYRVEFAPQGVVEVMETDEGESDDREALAANERLLAVRYGGGEERWTNTMELALDFLGNQLNLFQ